MTTVLTNQRIEENAINEHAFSSRKTPDFMHYKMVVCANCDLAYANPSPDIDWLRANYVRASFDASKESKLAAKAHSRLLDRVLRKLPDRDCALDIGTGDGAFLEELLKRGFTNIEGLEPAISPISKSSKNINRFITRAFFDSDHHESNRFSIVSCFQVLEHVDDLGSLVRSVFRILKPEGYFLTVSHNYRAWTARILGERSPIFDIEHLQLLSKKSLRNMYEKNDFINFKSGSMTSVFPLNYWVKLSPLPSGQKKMITRLNFRLGLSRIVSPLRAGNLWAYGMKPAINKP